MLQEVVDFFDQCDKAIRALPEVAPQIFKIRTKEEGIRPIIPRPLQNHYQEHRTRQELVLKARQGGFSTWKELEGLLLMMSLEGFMGAIISHKISSTKYLLSMVWNAYKMLPEEYRIPLVHETEEYLLTPPPPEGTGAGLYVGTAGPGAADFARSRTLHWVHGSEVAYWSDMMGVLTAVEGSVPSRGYTCLETTANGRNDYYDLYMDAEARGYKRHFFPWWWVPEYREEAKANFVPTEEELSLMETAARQGFQLTNDHLTWRRKRVARLGAKFQQEFPEDEVTCFLVSGNPRFDTEFVARLVTMAEARPRLREEPKPYGQLRIWLDPGVGHTYVIGADPSRGIAHGDYGAAVVEDVESGQHVASLHCKTPPHLFAQELANLGERYHDAMLTVERTGPGEAVLVALRNIGYDNVYTQKRWDDDHEMERIGWETTRKSKHRLCSSFDNALSCGDFMTWDLDLLDQALNVMIDDNGEPYTAKNKRDDLLMAAMLANETAPDAAPVVAVSGSFAETMLGVA